MSSSDSEYFMTPPELKKKLPKYLLRTYCLRNPEINTTRHMINKKMHLLFSLKCFAVLFLRKNAKIQAAKIPCGLLYCMSKSTILARNDINIIKYKKLTAFLKSISKEFLSKKSKALLLVGVV